MRLSLAWIDGYDSRQRGGGETIDFMVSSNPPARFRSRFPSGYREGAARGT